MVPSWLAPFALLIAASLFTAWRVGQELGTGAFAARFFFHALMAFAFSGAAAVSGTPSLDAACLGAMATICVAIALVDARTFLIPDALVAALLAVALIMPSAPSLVDQAIGATAIGGIFLLVRVLHKSWRGEHGLGLGDVKLATVMGALLGPLPALIAVAAAALFTAAWILAVTAPARTDSGKPAAAFGVGLALATIATAAARFGNLT